VKIGVFGGTFDPIHFGHLLLAEQARDAAGLDKVIFIPAGSPPFKQEADVSDGEHRYRMVQLAIEDNDRFHVSDMEIKRRGISYTVTTLDQCRNHWGEEAEIYFIVGTDAFLSMGKWVQAERLLQEYPVIVGSRAGSRDEERDKLADKFRREYGAEIIVAFMPKIEISSTDIKSRLLAGRSLRYILPAKVEEYIKEKGLYECN
jgi:nicotinate-nucleotide adenylyltransferase